MHAKRSPAFVPLAVGIFLASSLIIFFLTADLFHPALDEGIYLEGGHRILSGQVPYRDFFAYTGPLIYWVQALLEKIFGADVRMLRLSTVISVGLTCFGIFWMAERFVGWKTGIGVCLFYLGMRMPSFQHFQVNHRWLSTSLLTLSIAVALEAVRSPRARWLWLAAGALAGGAAWATPTDVIALAALIVWTAFRESRRALAMVVLGAAAISLPAVLALAWQGALFPMFDRLVWATRQYSVANHVPFGWYPYGFQATRNADGILNRSIAFVEDVRLVIPAVLIPLSLLLGLIEVIRRRWKGPAALLVWLSAAMLLTTWPRWDVNLLIGVTPPCYVVLTLWAEERLRAGARLPLRAGILGCYAIALTLSFAYAARLVSTVDSFNYFPTRLGLLRNIEEDGDAYAALEARIPEGATVFVYPYLPSLGFALRAVNPTSWSYLQPGMMSRADEAKALRELEARPPRLILRQFLSVRDILAIWPGSDRSLMTFPSIDSFIETRYRPVDEVGSPHFRVRVFEQRGP